MTDIAVELTNVTKRFGQVTAVDRVSLGIEEGEFFSLLGPSGCGKTTSLRLIAGFELPTEGEVHIHGRLMGSTPPFQRPVNMVFQHYALFPHMTVGDNVAFGLEMKGVSRTEVRKQVAEALAMVRLPGMEDRKTGQLSGGQQQRVALARALINRPEVLLLDEPLGALDLKLRKEMQLELKHLQERVGITFVYVTHDQEEALIMSDRIAVMNRGQTLQVGDPVEIYERPATRFVADFIGETNFMEGRLTHLSSDRATVLIDDTLPVPAAPTQAVRVGERVTLAIRPEKISLVEADRKNTLAGQVREVIYMGTDTRYTIQLTEKSAVVARVQNLDERGRPQYQPGEGVHIRWAPETARLLKE